jgi:hypothetical protein
MSSERQRRKTSKPGSLNARQLELLLYALRHPEAEFTTRTHHLKQGIDPQVARQDLNGLVELGYMTKRRIGPADVFYPVDHLDQRIVGLI